MVPLTQPQAAALDAIRGAFPDADIVLIGALALGRHVEMSHRSTDDLDLAIAVPMESFAGPIVSLDGWTQHAKMEHRFFSADGQMVDVLPASRALVERGYIEWSSGERMSLVGFDLAFAHHTSEQAGDTAVLVPSAPVLAFLKMRAWLDRPEMRRKDLADLAHLLVCYVGDDADRRFEGEVLELGMEFEDVSPFLLGRDLAQLMSAVHRPHVLEFLDRATPEQLTAHGPPSWHSTEHAERALSCFREGLDE